MAARWWEWRKRRVERRILQAKEALEQQASDAAFQQRAAEILRSSVRRKRILSLAEQLYAARLVSHNLAGNAFSEPDFGQLWQEATEVVDGIAEQEKAVRFTDAFRSQHA